MLKHFEWTLGILASVVAAAGLISLIQRMFSVEMAATLAEYVQYYRGLVHSLLDWVPLPFGWHIPQWYYDALALNSVATGAYIRSETLAKSKSRTHPLSHLGLTLVPFASFINIVFGAPFWAVAETIWPKLGRDFTFQEVALALVLFGISALATGAFFAVNQLLLG